MEIGDWVQWCGGSFQNLRGIVVDIRVSFNDMPEAKVIWDQNALGSYAQEKGGAWQRQHSLKVLSAMEKNDESR